MFLTASGLHNQCQCVTSTMAAVEGLTGLTWLILFLLLTSNVFTQSLGGNPGQEKMKGLFQKQKGKLMSRVTPDFKRDD